MSKNDPFQTLSKHFPAVAKKYDLESMERKDTLGKNQMSKIYKRIKIINGLMLADHQIQKLKTYLQNKQYQNEQTPFPYSLVQRQHDDGIIKQMSYTPQKYQAVHQKLQNIMKTIEQTLNTQVQVNPIYHRQSLTPHRNTQSNQQKKKKVKQITSSTIDAYENVKQRFDQVGNLIYDKQTLELISKKCMLNENDKIIILDDFHPQRRYVDPSNKIGEENYYIIYNVNGKPVSQIQYGFSYDDDDSVVTMEISSETKATERQKHYNTVLRAITIILSPTMMLGDKPVVQIISQAQNPLSVYSLLKLGFSYKNSQHVVDANQKSFNVSWYSPSLNKTQTAQQKQKRTEQQGKLFSYIDNIWEWDPDYFEIYMYLTKDKYPQAVRLAKNTLYRLRKCSIQG